MEFIRYAFFGFAALVLIFIAIIAWRVIKVPLGEGEGTRGKSASSEAGKSLDQHRDNY